jgi:hypothetical protein
MQNGKTCPQREADRGTLRLRPQQTRASEMRAISDPARRFNEIYFVVSYSLCATVRHPKALWL